MRAPLHSLGCLFVKTSANEQSNRQVNHTGEPCFHPTPSRSILHPYTTPQNPNLFHSQVYPMVMSPSWGCPTTVCPSTRLSISSAPSAASARKEGYSQPCRSAPCAAICSSFLQDEALGGTRLPGLRPLRSLIPLPRPPPRTPRLTLTYLTLPHPQPSPTPPPSPSPHPPPSHHSGPSWWDGRLA